MRDNLLKIMFSALLVSTGTALALQYVFDVTKEGASAGQTPAKTRSYTMQAVEALPETPPYPRAASALSEPVNLAAPDSAGEKAVRDLDAIHSLEDLVTELNTVSPRDFNFDAAVEFISGSATARDTIFSILQTSEDPGRRELLLNILDNLNDPRKIDFAMDLMQSPRAEERRRAYDWLATQNSQRNPEIAELLLDALTNEVNEAAVSDLLSRMPFPSPTDNKSSYDRAALLLEALSFQPNEQLAIEAVAAIGRMEASETRRAILQAHLVGSRGAVQLEAIKGLSQLDTPDEELMQTLNTLVYTPSVPQQTRREAVQLVVQFENRLGRQHADNDG